MDKPIPEAVRRFHRKWSWLVLTRVELEYLHDLVALTAAQPQLEGGGDSLASKLAAEYARGRIDGWDAAKAAPPSAPVGVEGLLSRAYEAVRHGIECPAIKGNGDSDCDCGAVTFLRDLECALAQQPARQEPSDVGQLRAEVRDLRKRQAGWERHVAAAGCEYVRDGEHDALVNRRAERLEEALRWYANPEVYKPHPHGPAFDDRDLSFVAKNALTPNAAQPGETNEAAE